MTLVADSVNKDENYGREKILQQGVIELQSLYPVACDCHECAWVELPHPKHPLKPHTPHISTPDHLNDVQPHVLYGTVDAESDGLAPVRSLSAVVADSSTGHPCTGSLSGSMGAADTRTIAAAVRSPKAVCDLTTPGLAYGGC